MLNTAAIVTFIFAKKSPATLIFLIWLKLFFIHSQTNLNLNWTLKVLKSQTK